MSRRLSRFRSPVAVIVGVLAFCGGLYLVAFPFSVHGIDCGNTLTPRSIEISEQFAPAQEGRILGQLEARRECGERVGVRRIAGVPLLIAGGVAITVGATPRWRRRHRSRGRRSSARARSTGSARR